jgi:hypothetical protein
MDLPVDEVPGGQDKQTVLPELSEKVLTGQNEQLTE